MKLTDVRRVFGLLRRPRRKLAYWLAAGVILGGLEIVTLGLLLLTVSAIVGGAAAATSIVDRAVAVFGNKQTFLTWVLVALFFTAAARFALFMLIERRNERIAFGVAADLQKTVFDRLLMAPYAFYYSQKHGALTNAVCSIPLSEFLGVFFLPRAILSASTALFTGAFMLALAPGVFLAGAAAAAVYFYAVRKLVEKAVFQTNVVRHEAIQRHSEIVSEAMSGIRQIRIFGGEDETAEEFGFEAERYATNSAKETFIRLVPSQTVQFLFVAVLALVLLGINRSMTPEEFLLLAPVFVTYVYGAMRIMPSMSQFIEAILNISASLPHITALEEWLDVPPDPLGERKGVELDRLEKGVSFENVSFGFEEGQPVLRNLDLTIPARQVTAVVGPSGVGKSTLIDLVLKFVAPQEGRIVIDKTHDLADVDREAWFKMIGFVSQETFLFHTTIRNNLLYSNPAADTDQLSRACEKAGIWDFVRSLPEGLETEIGDRGVTLSGGQRQRLAIARALVRDPQLLIFDEATNALDEETEAQVMDMVYELARHATVILIAHRLSTIERADMIVALQPGFGVATGDFSELASRGLIPSAQNKTNAPSA